MAANGSLGKEVSFSLDDAAFSSDFFRMYEFKVKRCPRARPHDWTQCPFAHPGEKAKRRDPRRYKYSGTACPDFRKNGCCRRGDACPFAHGVFECWLHPSRYRTQSCTDGTACSRRVCFFAHVETELRKPEVDPVLQATQVQAELAADLQSLQQAQLAQTVTALLEAQSRTTGAQTAPYNVEMLRTMALPSPAALLGAAAPSPALQSLPPGALEERARQLQAQLQQVQALAALQQEMASADSNGMVEGGGSMPAKAATATRQAQMQQQLQAQVDQELSVATSGGMDALALLATTAAMAADMPPGLRIAPRHPNGLANGVTSLPGSSGGTPLLSRGLAPSPFGFPDRRRMSLDSAANGMANGMANGTLNGLTNGQLNGFPGSNAANGFGHNASAALNPAMLAAALQQAGLANGHQNGLEHANSTDLASLGAFTVPSSPMEPRPLGLLGGSTEPLSMRRSIDLGSIARLPPALLTQHGQQQQGRTLTPPLGGYGPPPPPPPPTSSPPHLLLDDARRNATPPLPPSAFSAAPGTAFPPATVGVGNFLGASHRLPPLSVPPPPPPVSLAAALPNRVGTPPPPLQLPTTSATLSPRPTGGLPPPSGGFPAAHHRLNGAHPPSGALGSHVREVELGPGDEAALKNARTLLENWHLMGNKAALAGLASSTHDDLTSFMVRTGSFDNILAELPRSLSEVALAEHLHVASGGPMTPVVSMEHH